MQMKKLARIAPGFALILMVCLFIACGGNGVTTDPGSVQDNTPQLQLADEQLADRTTGPGPESSGEVDINRVSLEVPSLAGLQAGEEFTAVLSLEAVQQIHQGVLRIHFDQTKMTPIESVPGEMLPGNMVRIASLDKPGYIPFAFTALPGEQGIRPGGGALLSVRFRLNSSGAEAGRLGFSEAPDFLQLRGAEGNRLQFELSNRAGGSNE